MCLKDQGQARVKTCSNVILKIRDLSIELGSGQATAIVKERLSDIVSWTRESKRRMTKQVWR